MPTFKGNNVTLQGNPVKVGDQAPDFRVLTTALEEVTLASYPGKKLISVIPSIDTGVCDAQTREFNEKASSLGGTVLTVSNDLPFAQRRWCSASGLDNVVTLSDHRDLSFAKAYGVLIEEMRLLARSVFVVDSNDVVQYVQYMDEMTDEVDFEAALKAFEQAN
ncbi:thiol peroxidase [Exiguobacterium sp. s129]|uniref:thiol peroxidase n=1 Tax=Exiguobacterium sp. s129 TaxID=2751264 RepID=UPI001BEA3646|nr:thiol peroxidase [Exiguobacterium sp. s129]